MSIFSTSNNNGNLLGQTITVPSVGGVSGFTATQTYSYDALNRLAIAQENNGGSWKQNFDYDRYGNRKLLAGTTLPAVLTAANNPVINASNNRLDNTAAGQTNVLYDSAGNLTGEVAGHTYQYDAENKLVSYDGGATVGGGASYGYDGDGRRVMKVVGGSSLVTTVFVYDIMGQLVAEYSSSGSVNSGTSYLTSDTLGSPRVITGASQEMKGRHDYLPFGEELVAGTGGRTTTQGYTQSNGLRQHFTSKERDNETGLDYFGARYYASTQGRFTSPDPLLASGQANLPQSWNRYTYVVNNPLINVDPTGLWWYTKDGGDGHPEWFDNDPGKGYTRFNKDSYYAGEKYGYVALDPYSKSYQIGFDTEDEASAYSNQLASETLQTRDPGQYVSQIDGTMEVATYISGVQALVALTKTGVQFLQRDGATVFLKEVTPGKFNVIVEGSRGVVTALKNISEKSVARLSQNHGWLSPIK